MEGSDADWRSKGNIGSVADAMETNVLRNTSKRTVVFILSQKPTHFIGIIRYRSEPLLLEKVTGKRLF